MGLHDFQVWLVTTIKNGSPVAEFMQTAWAWPLAESFHFIGLSLLVGGVVTFDLRVLGVAKSVPLATMHRFVKWGLLGFTINFCTGMLFLLTEPDQYIYNASFHFKLLFMAIGGLNAAVFYLTSFNRVFGKTGALDAPRYMKLIAAVSLCAWLGVIVGGRLLTFYRPGECFTEPGLLLACDPRLGGLPLANE